MSSRCQLLNEGNDIWKVNSGEWTFHCTVSDVMATITVANLFLVVTAKCNVIYCQIVIKKNSFLNRCDPNKVCNSRVDCLLAVNV